jgi:hypothetical protein
MSPQVQGPSGVSADHTFIQEGQTGRDEILKRLGWADAGLSQERFFWGRWSASTKGVATVMVIPGAVGGQTDRTFAIHNLLVEFDEHAIVVRARKVKDGDVFKELVSWSRYPGLPAMDVSSRNRKSYAAWTYGSRRHNGSMVLNADFIEFFDHHSRVSFKVPRDKIVNVKMTSKNDVKPTWVLKVRDETAWGKEIDFWMDPPELLAALQYMVPARP